MGSRSKFHKSDVATTHGRMLFHMGARRAEDPKAVDPRRQAKRLRFISFTTAFWDALRGYRAAALKGERRPPREPAKARPMARAARRGLERRLVRGVLERTFGQIPGAAPRAERRRAALVAARKAARP